VGEVNAIQEHRQLGGVELGTQGAFVELREAEATLLEALCGVRRYAGSSDNPAWKPHLHAAHNHKWRRPDGGEFAVPSSSEAIRASGTLNLPRRRAGSTVASIASSFSEGSMRR